MLERIIIAAIATAIFCQRGIATLDAVSMAKSIWEKSKWN